MSEAATPSARERVVSALTPLFRGFEPDSTTILIGASVALLLFKKYGGSGTFLGTELFGDHPRRAVIGQLYWFLACFMLLGLAPALLCRLRLGRAVGTGLGDWRFGLRTTLVLYALMLPVLFAVSRTEAFWHHYPLSGFFRDEALNFARTGAPDDWLWWLVIYEAAYVLYFIGWEYFFRGFLTLGLEPRLGFTAVLVANVPFVVLHAGKPFLEGLGSVVGGIALGLFVLRARSFWYAWLLHALVAVSMDLMALERRLSVLSGS